MRALVKEPARRLSGRNLSSGGAPPPACLWPDQGKRTEARDLLGPIYDWFTEDFDTPVLKKPKYSLSSSPHERVRKGSGPR
jgi:hypothetical protein